LQVTMTTPNFVNTVNELNQIVKRMSEQNKAQQEAASNKEDSAEVTIEADTNDETLYAPL
jgi:hypothetical protein